MDQVTAFAPASIANLGPGFDVLGVAIEGPGDTVVATKREESGVTITKIQGDDSLPTEADKNTAGVAARHVLELLNADSGVELELTKGVTGGSGLGSSATSAAAAAFATNALFDGELGKLELLIAATEGEVVASGDFFADNTAPSLLGGATLIQSYDPFQVVELGVIPDARLVLVTPRLTIITQDAREILPKRVRLKDAVANTGNAAAIAVALAVGEYELFATSLVDVVIEPARAKLITGFDDVK